jgi:multimeric flavodoxin WrbA
MRVLTLCGSIRASRGHTDKLLALAHTEGPIEDFITHGKRLAESGVIFSNSEIVSAAVMKGVLSSGGEIDYFPINDLFPRKITPVIELRPGSSNDKNDLVNIDSLGMDDSEFETFLARLANADGVVLTTPVYFGDRSSVANKFMQITAQRSLLKGKIFGVASVGAKRNGGQETCDIFSMVEALNQNALVVGNGPPTSQYGGTVVAGTKGLAFEDSWGLQTSFGVGTKTAHVGKLYALGSKAPPPDKVRIDILITMDTAERFLLGYLEQLAARVLQQAPWADFHFHILLDSTIYRCLGCPTCPAVPGNRGTQPRCTIKDPADCLEQLRAALHHSDCMVVAGLNLLDPSRIIYRYQVLTERMRYIRRNNFELTDLVVAGLAYNEFGAKVNPIHTIKTLTSFIRQNTTIHRPIEIFEHRGVYLDDGTQALLDLCLSVRRMKAGRSMIPAPESRYVAHGEAGGYI